MTTFLVLPFLALETGCFSEHFYISRAFIKFSYVIAKSGAYAGFLKGGAQLKKFLEVGYTCRKAACYEQRSCVPLLGGLGAYPPQENF